MTERMMRSSSARTGLVASWMAAWNAHDVDAVVAVFTADARVRQAPAPPPPFQAVSTGTEQIRAWVHALLPGLHFRATSCRQYDDRVTWVWTLSAALAGQRRVTPVIGVGELVMQGDRATAFIATLNPATLAVLQAAARRQDQPR